MTFGIFTNAHFYWINKCFLNKNKKYLIYDSINCFLYQKRALKSSEQVKNADEFGECTIERIGPLWPKNNSQW